MKLPFTVNKPASTMSLTPMLIHDSYYNNTSNNDHNSLTNSNQNLSNTSNKSNNQISRNLSNTPLNNCNDSKLQGYIFSPNENINVSFGSPPAYHSQYIPSQYYASNPSSLSYFPNYYYPLSETSSTSVLGTKNSYFNEAFSKSSSLVEEDYMNNVDKNSLPCYRNQSKRAKSPFLKHKTFPTFCHNLTGNTNKILSGSFAIQEILRNHSLSFTCPSYSLSKKYDDTECQTYSYSNKDYDFEYNPFSSNISLLSTSTNSTFNDTESSVVARNDSSYKTQDGKSFNKNENTKTNEEFFNKNKKIEIRTEKINEEKCIERNRSKNSLDYLDKQIVNKSAEKNLNVDKNLLKESSLAYKNPNKTNTTISSKYITKPNNITSINPLNTDLEQLKSANNPLNDLYYATTLQTSTQWKHPTEAASNNLPQNTINPSSGLPPPSFVTLQDMQDFASSIMFFSQQPLQQNQQNVTQIDTSNHPTDCVENHFFNPDLFQLPQNFYNNNPTDLDDNFLFGYQQQQQQHAQQQRSYNSQCGQITSEILCF